MNRRQRQQLEDRLRDLPKAERDVLYSEARKKRGEARKRRSSKAREVVDGERVGGSRRPDPLSDWVLRLLAQRLQGEEGVGDGEDGPRHELSRGVVVGLTKRIATVKPESGGDALECRLGAELAGRQQAGIAVGDDVLIVERDDPGSGAPVEVARVLPRRTELSRPDPGDPRKRRVVAANVDVVVIVVSVKAPPLHPRLIDRYLVAAQHGGASAIVAVNKADLLAGDELEEELKRLDPYRKAGVRVVVCKAAPEDGSDARVADLRAALAGKTCVFVGHSGVGKSSLANALDASLGIDTGGVRKQDARGRHTTTASTMHEVGDGIRVIDTPGVRYFGLADVTPEELADAFGEFAPYAGECRFRDCGHSHEPDCSVRSAAERGDISPERYETYLRLMEELSDTTGRPPTDRIRPMPDDAGM